MHSWQLETERLRLLPFAEEHVGDLHRLWTDPQVRRFLWDGRTISQAEAAALVGLSRRTFEEHGFGFWSLFPHRAETLVGFAGLRFFGDAQEVEILYGLEPTSWHRGLATEASRAVLDFAFGSVGLEEIFAGADSPNAASFRVMTRLGFQPHGPRVMDGVEAVYYSLKRRDAGPG